MAKSKRDPNKQKPTKAQKRQNPKAFAFSGTGAAHKAGMRNAEKQQQRLHVPLVDRIGASAAPPPVVVAVVGPPKVSKLFKSYYLSSAYA